MASYAAKTKESYQNIIKEVISQIQEQNSQGNIEIDEQVLKILKQVRVLDFSVGQSNTS